MTEWNIFDTEHWQVSHRRDARYPGYLMVSSVAPAVDFASLADSALSTLGGVLRQTEQLLVEVYAPWKVVVYKLGFSPGLNLHFHVVPVTRSLLAQIAAHPDYPSEPDGNDTLLFLSRIHCERSLNTAEREAQRATVMALRARVMVSASEGQGPVNADESLQK